MRGVDFYGLARESGLFGKLMTEQVFRVISTGSYLQSLFVASFEERMRKIIGRLEAIAVNSGTDALVISLRALGIGKGDEVLAPAFSFVASASCIKLVGATPVYVDCGSDYNIDLEKASNLVSSRTKAIVYPHLFGNMGDPWKIEAFRKDHNIFVIEDAAQAFGASKQGWNAGSVGDVSCFSFDPTKPLAAPGSGGMILTNSHKISDACRDLRYHCKGSPLAGYNSQMNSISAAVLEWKLDISDTNYTIRKSIADKYSLGLKGVVNMLQDYEDPGHCVSKFVIETEGRDSLKSSLREDGIETKISYPRPTFDELGDEAECPVAMKKCERVLSLPSHAYLSDEESDLVVDKIKEWKNNVSNGEYSLLQ
jgi:dTDP-4-amino-4,6-dideoxygalactose transaminase